MAVSTGSLISTERFLEYADYFALIADSGINSAKSIFGTISIVINVNTATYENRDNAISVRNSLAIDLQSSYEQISTSAVSLEPMRDAFRELSDHILFHTVDTVDNYLTNNSLKVKSTYARINRLSTGETISAENRED